MTVEREGTAQDRAHDRFAADWNRTHLSNPAWPPHARFHSVVTVQTNAAAGLAALWLLWTRPPDHPGQEQRITAAELLPALMWLPLLPAALVPGAAPEDAPGETPRLVGLPLNLLGAAVLPLVGLAGHMMRRQGTRRSRRP